MAWNQSSSNYSKKPASGSKKLSPAVKGGLALILIWGLGSLVWWLVSVDDLERPVLKKDKPVGAIAEVSPAPASVSSRIATEAQIASEIAAEYAEQMKSLVKVATNDVSWIVKPLDPADPDNALRTRVSQELGSLLSIEPGDPMPPFPYSFLVEDEMLARADAGEDVGEIDNGNKGFIESLKKYKIQAKNGDGEDVLAHKDRLLSAQSELLGGMDEGLSVNDSIRAAYEFRKRAYEVRTAGIAALKDLCSEENMSAEDAGELLNEFNGRMSAEGIKTISMEEIGYEEEDPANE